MKIFERASDTKRILVYNSLDQNLIDRHYDWCKTAVGEKIIYMVFLLRNKEEYRLYRSNQLANNYCIVYQIPETKSDAWLINFCSICYDQKFIDETRVDYEMRMW